MLAPHAKTLCRDTCLPVDFDTTREENDLIFLKETKQENKNVLAPIKILIVEDTEICQKIALLMLSQPDYVADLAITGKEAITKYSEGYEVILLDLGLPDMSGIEVCSYIRKKIGDRQTPIIAYSAISDTLHQECVEAGFSEILTKPTEKQVLNNIIKNLVKKNKIVE